MAVNEIQMTETEATEEAMRLMIRKVRRMYPEAFAAVMAKMPVGAREILAVAEIRADDRFLTSQREGTIRTWPVVFEDEGDED
jgi:hypothetical protein